MVEENLGDLVAQMVALAVKNPKVVNPGYKGKDAVVYDNLIDQLNELQQDYSLLEKRVDQLEKSHSEKSPPEDYNNYNKKSYRCDSSSKKYNY
ncbi:hypothetical protein HY494_03275 [Candidatus Woesearchaeota archaeon]|nr:hypothetical protein [Candidatus Woesearchaeota archaeon]